MKSKHKVISNEGVFTFENGVELTDHCVTIPATGEIGGFNFPIRHSGDVFHAFTILGAAVANIPASCKAW
jgi:hypothetical protein